MYVGAGVRVDVIMYVAFFFVLGLGLIRRKGIRCDERVTFALICYVGKFRATENWRVWTLFWRPKGERKAMKYKHSSTLWLGHVFSNSCGLSDFFSSFK